MTTTRECRCTEYNRPICEKRAARSLPCLLTMKSTGQTPRHMTFREAEQAAKASGGRVRCIDTGGHYGSPRKFYVEAR